MLSSPLQRLITIRLCYFILTAVSFASADPIPVSVPSTAPGHNVVQSNFLGISLELSFMNEYSSLLVGNDTSTIPPTILNYLSAIRGRTGDSPLRLRVGGNSMDSSVYMPELATPMLQNTSTAANANNQPVNYGPMLWKVMKKVADDIGGAEYLIGVLLKLNDQEIVTSEQSFSFQGLALLDPNNLNVPVIAGAAEQVLGNALDGYLLGNVGIRLQETYSTSHPLQEPDLYTSHRQRPNIKNYTTNIYIDEFKTVSDRLTNTSAGNLLNLKNLGGPTVLPIFSLQHYPQNNCFGSYQHGLPYYIQHANGVFHVEA
ncbi:hypothetical protein C0995_005497 [Termitomyces sp. Mi166|nr:hypothetical protein C0995_005497 [Termitomyces sp. Mi166\